SLTPQIAGRWEDDPDLFSRVFPMDLRAQAHDIIRTWLFSTVVRSHFEENMRPWRHVAISGFVLDPDRKKMSKSKGNVVTPLPLLEEYGADAVRYWAASGRPGVDTAVDYGQLKVGRRLTIKLLNASRFVLGRLEGADASPTPAAGGPVAQALDAAMVAGLADVVDDATAAFEAYDYTRALERTETVFWAFCDDYLELVKSRAYGTQGPEARASATTALVAALSTLLRLFAPFLPFATEEVWSWGAGELWPAGSVHRARWPAGDELRATAGAADPLVLEVAAAALGEIRKAKTAARASMRADVARAVVRDTPDRLAALGRAADDVAEAGRVADLATEAAGAFSVTVELVPGD
ncbi:MAG: class I tRNA ligase family protein, partial [Acidimicrobiales bacterium]